MKPRLQFHRLGSDAEFAFASGKDWVLSLEAAPVHIKLSRERGMRPDQWIGLDGHTAVAEIRAAPARNVWLHLINLAEAISHLEAYCTPKSLYAVAQPTFRGEPLGGHIHLSFWLPPDISPPISWRGNLVVNTSPPAREERPIRFDPQEGFVEVTPEEAPFPVEPAPPGRTVARAALSVGYSLDLMIDALDRVLLPFEWAAQNNPLVAERQELYRDIIRPARSTNPRPDRPNYVHIEYRRPSTWLIHPWMAYCYLALVKLVMLNIPHVSSRKYSGAPLTEITHDPTKARAAFDSAFHELVNKSGCRYSNDLRPLPRVLEAFWSIRDSLVRPPGKIDFVAWSKLTKGVFAP